MAPAFWELNHIPGGWQRGKWGERTEAKGNSTDPRTPKPLRIKETARIASSFRVPWDWPWVLGKWTVLDQE
jgi:hypothetical protein